MCTHWSPAVALRTARYSFLNLFSFNKCNILVFWIPATQVFLLFCCLNYLTFLFTFHNSVIYSWGPYALVRTDASLRCAQLIFNFFSNGIFVSFAFVLALCKFNCVFSYVLQFICGIKVCKILLWKYLRLYRIKTKHALSLYANSVHWIE